MNLPLRKCSTPGCPGLTLSGKCLVCQQTYETRRGSSAKRGYDSAWRRYRGMFLRRFPFCMDPFGCHSGAGELVEGSEVDHIRPHGGDREKFLDPANHGTLCHACHAKKTFLESSGSTVIYQKRSKSDLLKLLAEAGFPMPRIAGNVK